MRAFSAIERWGSLGLTEPGWAERLLQGFGHNSASGSWVFSSNRRCVTAIFVLMLQNILALSAMVQSVAATLNAIGYASFGAHLSGE